MARLAIVAYPTLQEEDRVWVESLRTANDPQASRIAAHITLVFPVELEVQPVLAHTRSLVATLEPLKLVLREATAVPDVLGRGSHVFLVPEEGRAELVALHDRLYSGVLAPYARAEIPFVPHITVAAFEQLEASAEFAATLNRDGLAIRGTVACVYVVDASEHQVRTLAEFPAPRG